MSAVLLPCLAHARALCLPSFREARSDAALDLRPSPRNHPQNLLLLWPTERAPPLSIGDAWHRGTRDHQGGVLQGAQVLRAHAGSVRDRCAARRPGGRARHPGGARCGRGRGRCGPHPPAAERAQRAPPLCAWPVRSWRGGCASDTSRSLRRRAALLQAFWCDLRASASRARQQRVPPLACMAPL